MYGLIFFYSIPAKTPKMRTLKNFLFKIYFIEAVSSLSYVEFLVCRGRVGYSILLTV